MTLRIANLSYLSPANQNYVKNGGQDAFRAIGVLYDLLLPLTEGGDDFASESSQIKLSVYIKPLVLLLLAYASEVLSEEGRASTGTEAAAIALVDILSSQAEGELDAKTMTVDDFISKFLEFIFFEKDGDTYKVKNSKLSNTVIGGLVSIIPEGTLQEAVVVVLEGFDKNFDPEKPIVDQMQGILAATFKACVVGADPECVMSNLPTGREARDYVFQVFVLCLYSFQILILP